MVVVVGRTEVVKDNDREVSGLLVGRTYLSGTFGVGLALTKFLAIVVKLSTCEIDTAKRASTCITPMDLLKLFIVGCWL